MSSYGGPYAPGYSAYNPDPAGYTVQTGYEGYLVPTLQQRQPTLGESIGAISSGLQSTLGQTFVNGLGAGSALGALGSGTALGLKTLDLIESPFSFFKGVIPLGKTILGLLFKVGAVIYSAVSVVAIGGFITMLLCTFTNVCTLKLESFPGLNWLKTAKDVTESISSEVSSERIKRAVEILISALDKYHPKEQLDIPEEVHEEEEHHEEIKP